MGTSSVQINPVLEPALCFSWVPFAAILIQKTMVLLKAGPCLFLIIFLVTPES